MMPHRQDAPRISTAHTRGIHYPPSLIGGGGVGAAMKEGFGAYPEMTIPKHQAAGRTRPLTPLKQLKKNIYYEKHRPPRRGCRGAGGCRQAPAKGAGAKPRARQAKRGDDNHISLIIPPAIRGGGRAWGARSPRR